MIHFKLATDAPQVVDILTNDYVWSAIADDYSPKKEDFVLPYGVYVLAMDDNEVLGVYQVETMTTICFKLHTSYLPTAWGERALEASKKFIEWLFNITGAEMFVGFVPSHNMRMLAHARKCGMKEEGRIFNSVVKNGQHYDQIIMKIVKE